jgi:ArsR family transcriptional regulator, arsenate/arsenite/antimonite-responsive transcriptional repressor
MPNIDIEIYKALSDESRLRILNLLMKSKLCVCEIEEVLRMSQTNVSRHLNKLKNAQIVVSKKEAQWAYHFINEDFIKDHKKLYEHLKKRSHINAQLLEDAKKMDVLKKQGGSCTTIVRTKTV